MKHISLCMVYAFCSILNGPHLSPYICPDAYVIMYMSIPVGRWCHRDGYRLPHKPPYICHPGERVCCMMIYQHKSQSRHIAGVSRDHLDWGRWRLFVVQIDCPPYVRPGDVGLIMIHTRHMDGWWWWVMCGCHLVCRRGDGYWYNQQHISVPGDWRPLQR